MISIIIIQNFRSNVNDNNNYHIIIPQEQPQEQPQGFFNKIKTYIKKNPIKTALIVYGTYYIVKNICGIGKIIKKYNPETVQKIFNIKKKQLTTFNI
jgi:hypothetical protein